MKSIRQAAILELIEKCETLEELRESVKRIMNDEK